MCVVGIGVDGEPYGEKGVGLMGISVDIQHAFRGFSLDVRFEAHAGVTALFGRSGSGKTTLINAIAGLLTPQSGRIVVGDRVLFDRDAGINVPVHKRGIGYVFQEPRLFPHLSVARNLRYGMRFRTSGAAALGFDHVVDLLGLSTLIDRAPAGLSGGEKQRVAIGRALLSSPDILLMDEPLAALDAPRKAEILPFLARLRDEVAVPIVYVSHSMGEVARLASHMVMLKDGAVITQGHTEAVLSDPEMVPWVGVRSAGSVLSARLDAQEPDGLSRLAISGGVLYMPKVAGDIGAQVRVRVMAQDVMLSLSEPSDMSALNILRCRVLSIRKGDGPGAIVQLECGTDRLLARVTRRSVARLALDTGSQCYAVLKTVSVGPVDIG